jgi:tetratricopeptide (TPR) repeat protein
VAQDIPSDTVDEAVASDPPSKWLDDAIHHHRAGDIEAAGAGYRRILDRDPEQADALNNLGLIALDRGDSETAARVFGQAAQGHPEVALFRFNLGEAHRIAGRFSEAAAAYTEAVALNEADPDSHYVLGYVLHRLGRPGEAVAHYEAAARLDPERSEALHFRAIAAWQGGNETEAIRYAAEALRRNGFGEGFFGWLNDLIENLEAEESKAVRRFLRRNRLLPRQAIGRLGALADFEAIDPWYFSRRMIDAYPRKLSDFDDLAALIEKHVIKGWTPETPPFAANARLLTLGSCFAEELRNYLCENRKETDWMFVPPGLNNTFALRAFIDWCLSGDHSDDACWYDEHTSGGAVKWTPEGEQARYREVFERADGLVLTVGLAEVWEDKETGGVFWRGIPKRLFDEDKHVCRMSTVEENEANLLHIVEAMRETCGEKPIIITLSPVPLKSTFLDVSCVSADCLSKSILRVAIGNLMTRRIPNLYYWPSFEIVKWLSPHLPYAVFGEDRNLRHVNREVVTRIVDSFLAHFFRREGTQ